MQSIIKIKQNFEFTEEHRETAEAFLRKEAFPQFYTNDEFPTLKYKGVFLIAADAILRDGNGSSQSVRYDGLNHKYKELKQDVNENGYQLYQRPISVTKNSEGRYVFIDGRTKDKIYGLISVVVKAGSLLKNEVIWLIKSFTKKTLFKTQNYYLGIGLMWVKCRHG